jgi:membrane associated rhomboid family serine protease
MNFRKNRFSFTTILIAVNVLFFILLKVILAFNPMFRDFLELNAGNIIHGKYIWTLLTSVFLHESFAHLFVNMFSLFFLGRVCERIVGRKRFIWFYVLAGIAGSIFFVLFAYLGSFFPRGEMLFGGLEDYAVGASGALFGLLGILAVLIPMTRVYLISGPIVIIILQVLAEKILPDSLFGVFYFISNLLILAMIFSMFSFSKWKKISMPLNLPMWLAPIIAIVPLLVIGYFVRLPIGNMAHFGGLVAGVVYGVYLRIKYSRKVAMLQRIIR